VESLFRLCPHLARPAGVINYLSMPVKISRRLSRRAEALTPSATLAIAKAAAELAKTGVDVVDLGLGEPDFATPDFVKRAGVAAIENNHTRYTDSAGTSPLREAVAEKFRRRGADVGLRNVLISAGGKQGLFNACQVLFQEGDEVAIYSPYWVSFPEMVRLSGATPLFVPTPREAASRPRLAELEARASENLRGVILNSPANPTGAVLEEAEILRILRWAKGREIFVLFDECYEYFLYDGRRHVSPAPYWSAHSDHVLISGAASKTFSMTGWRLGWSVGPPDVISACASYQSHATANACSISQQAALAALLDEQRASASVASMLAEYTRRREALCAALNAVEGVSCLLPDGAFYAFADVSSLYPAARAAGSVEFSRMLLEKAGVATVPGEAFGDDRCLRFSFASSLERIKEGGNRFARFAGGLRG
jgi:aspartate aminotransferase